MKLTSLISSATVCCSFLISAAAQQNFSLWPRRPAELEQARILIRNGDTDAAVQLLRPFINKQGLAGHEARQLTGAIRIRLYLSPRHPRIRTHTVRRGENIERIAAAYNSSAEFITLVNALMNPSALRAGQHLRVAPTDLRAEIHLASREISLWDGSSLVAVYDFIPSHTNSNAPNTETSIQSMEGELNGARIPRSSALFVCSNRILHLANGMLIHAASYNPPNNSPGIEMKTRDINELSLLVRKGSRVSIITDEQARLRKELGESNSTLPTR